MDKNYLANQSRCLTLAQVSSIVIALWVLYLAIRSDIQPLADNILIQPGDGNLVNNPLIWATQFFGLALVVALAFIIIAFIINRHDN